MNECAATKEAIITALEVSHQRLTRPWKIKMTLMTMVVMPILMVTTMILTIKTTMIANDPIADRIGPSIVGLVNPRHSASTHKTLNSFEVSS